jgi:hypothetical protein
VLRGLLHGKQSPLREDLLIPFLVIQDPATDVSVVRRRSYRATPASPSARVTAFVRGCGPFVRAIGKAGITSEKPTSRYRSSVDECIGDLLVVENP